MFALVDDVDAYPDFLPWCSKAEVHSRSDTEVEASLQLQKGSIRKLFRTRNRLQPPDTIGLSLVDGPFKHLDGGWRFEQLGDAGCKVSLELEFELENRVTDKLIGPFFEMICNTLVDAFTRRATDIYG